MKIKKDRHNGFPNKINVLVGDPNAAECDTGDDHYGRGNPQG